MAILAELWAARNEALTAKMAVLAPGPARGTLLAYFPREQAVAARQLEPEAPPVAPRRLLESRQVRRNGVSLCHLPQLMVR